MLPNLPFSSRSYIFCSIRFFFNLSYIGIKKSIVAYISRSDIVLQLDSRILRQNNLHVHYASKSQKKIVLSLAKPETWVYSNV